MTKDQRSEEFLAKAKRAEQSAQKSADANVKESWMAIAQSYRALAMFAAYPIGTNESGSWHYH